MATRLVRSMAVGLVVLTVIFVPGTRGLAASPARFSHRSVSIECPGVANDAGAFAFIFAGVSDVLGPSGSVEYWVPGTSPETGPPTLFGSEAVDGALTADTLSIEFAMVDGSGDPAGSATVSATFEPDGEPFAVEPFREGNRWFRTTGTIQPARITSGEFVAPDGQSILLADVCLGQIAELDVFETNPDTFVATQEGFFIECAWETAEERLFFFASATEDSAFGDLIFFSGDTVQAGSGSISLDTSGVSGSITLFDQTNGESVGDGTIEATFTPGERFSVTRQASTGKSKETGTIYTVAGAIALPNDTEFDMSTACTAADLRAHFAEHRPTGPHAGGKVPPNDTPDGAVALIPGRGLQQHTRGASPDPEAPCLVEFPDASFEVPLGHTVWYTVVGTGGPITIDTAGSDFDTVLGVYASDDSTLTRVACVDDVPIEPFGATLDAALTFESDAGVTYLVQAGGFAGEGFPPFGRLRIEAS